MPKTKVTMKAPNKRVLGAFTGFISTLDTKVVEGANKTLEKLANFYVEEVKRAIEEQAYKWKPLSDEYADQKAREGMDPRIYIRTGFFLDHIEVWKDKGGRTHAGVRPNVEHPDAKMSLVRLARIHEFGTLNGIVPARPLWRPALSKVLALRKRFMEQYQRHVKKGI